VRSYKRAPVGENKLRKIIEAAHLAPSAGNLQSYRIVVVRSQKLKEAIAKASHEQDFMVDAPVLLAFISDRKRSAAKYGKRGEEIYALQDATIAAAYCQLAAAALGLGTVWIGGFEQRKIDGLLKAKPHEFCAAIIPVGYAAEHMEGHERRSIEEMVSEM
ncbi:MAG: nitroreductase family protein, partial [Candidatus Micrarchaeota archaeon]|nr:nitroreductase family protein [Candidatus Micrarchaeota archaeon]